MKYVYFDAFSGCSGDMILGALLDLGADVSAFKKNMQALALPVRISVRETRRATLRGLKVEVAVEQGPTVHRKWEDVRNIIDDSPFSRNVKERSLSIFRRLFEAESRVHGHAFEQTHLHEAGADDALVDIVGFGVLAEMLDIEVFHASPLNLGGGWVKAAHGVLPVPAPAVSELLKDIPAYSAHVQKELVTPTGAAILADVVENFSALPELQYQRVGWGAGGHDLPDFPNLLRVFYGEVDALKPQGQVYQIEANVDDSTPQVLADFLGRALQAGALDVFLTPVVMKKNRLGSKISILSENRTLERLIRLLFLETSSIGVRFFPVARRVLPRHFREVHVEGEKIKVKVAELDGKPVNIQPEYDDCRRAARRLKKPLRQVEDLARMALQDDTPQGEKG
jgi:uncharacterized protein (TIGR00299 family) protein